MPTTAADESFVLPPLFPFAPIAIEDGGTKNDGAEHDAKCGDGSNGPDVVHSVVVGSVVGLNIG